MNFASTPMLSLVEKLKKLIIKTNISPLMPQYSYDGETGYNPFYEVITKDLPFTFCHDEKRIFALRTDFLMTTGRKNTDKKKQYPGSFHQKITGYLQNLEFL